MVKVTFTLSNYKNGNNVLVETQINLFGIKVWSTC